jgi:anti-sigma factor RsiW
MTCEQVREWMSAEMDGEAGDEMRRSVREHLADCAACRQDRAATAMLRGHLRSAGSNRPPDPARDDALVALLRREGLIAPAPNSSLGHADTGGAWGAHRRAGGLSLSRLRARCLSPCPRGGPVSAWQLALVMAATFVATWGPLRVAETGSISARPAARVGTATVSRPASGSPTGEWLRRPAALAARLLGERAWAVDRELLETVPAPRQESAPDSIRQRGARPQPVRRLG